MNLWKPAANTYSNGESHTNSHMLGSSLLLFTYICFLFIFACTLFGLLFRMHIHWQTRFMINYEQMHLNSSYWSYINISLQIWLQIRILFNMILWWILFYLSWMIKGMVKTYWCSFVISNNRKYISYVNDYSDNYVDPVFLLA